MQPFLVRFAFRFTVATTFLIAACSAEKNDAKPVAQPPVLVSVAPVIQKNSPVTIQAMGNAEACHSVAIKSRVDGEITKAHFADGQEIQQGQPLFDLDDRPFQYRLRQLKANLDRDLALLENARTREHRQTVLNKQNLSSEETLAGLVANRQAAEATVTADRAAIADGELQLAFTHIAAPITGMAGRILIQPGNLIKANDANPLVTLQQMDPICISFTVAESHLAEIRAHHAKAPLTLEIQPNRGNGESLPGTLLSLDNAVDRQTGTIRLKAQAANGERHLWPGLFVTLSLKLTDQPNAVVIPARAVQTGSKGPFAYVVKNDKSVESRFLTIAQEDKEEIVVATGVTAGETVVTVGQWRLKPGAKVEIAQESPANKESK
ncbi:MAG: efflux RND transporter periplasmic adaptor subunit [Magnetococcales bacterium]|nr:efflux RND transporter periplasmic adaptor subunit [Magnetococcales bacterium]